MREKIRDKGRLEHILESIDNVVEFTKGITFEDFINNKILRFAVVKNIEIIGEASYKLSKEIRETNNNIEWEAIIGLRHVLVHGYYQINKERLWKIIQKDLLPLREQIQTIWQKQGSDEKRKLTENAEIMRLFQQGSNLSADEMTVYGTSIEDVDERLFSDYFVREFKRPYREKGLTYEDALRVKRILFGGKMTLAGLLFFGREPQKFKPAFTIKLVSFIGNDSANQQYRSKPEDTRGTIPEMFKQAMSFLMSNIRHTQQNQGFNSIGIPEISPVALEEILQNALIHRDYFKNAPVRVFIFDNRIEIISPGKLPNNLTVEDVKYGNPVIRNNQIVAFGIHTLPYSGLGTGIKRALELQPDIELINDVEGEQFIVKIPRLLEQG